MPGLINDNFKLIGISLAAGLLSLLPPWVIGTGSSALALQSLEHWMRGMPDSFEALHVYWLWFPRILTFLTGDAFSALVVFRVLVVWSATLLFALTVRRLFDARRAMIGLAMLVLNVTILYFFHTCGSQLLTLLIASGLLYLFTSSHARDHRLGALLFGLSLAIGFWPFVLLIAVLTIGLNIHHARYTLRAKDTYLFFGIILLGAASYLLLELFYFGTAHVWTAINPHFYTPRGVSRIAEGIVIAVFSFNVLFVLFFRRKLGGIGKDFQPAFLILGIFFLANTFSRDAMLEDVVTILPCLILVALDKFEKIGRLAIIYCAVNLVVFLFLPSFTANPELASAEQRRVSSQDAISFSYYKAFDFFSYAKMRQIKAGEEEVRDLLSRERLNSTLVIVNSSTDSWFDAATLGAEFPNGNFGWYYGRPLNTVRWNGLGDSIFLRRNPAIPYLSGLFEKLYAQEFIDSTLPPDVPMRESEHFQFIDCRGNEAARKALLDQLFFLQYQGFHQR